MDGITDSMDLSLSKLRETVMDMKPGVLQSTGSQRVGHDLATEQQQKQQLGFGGEGNNRIGYMGDIANLAQKQ